MCFSGFKVKHSCCWEFKPFLPKKDEEQSAWRKWWEAAAAQSPEDGSKQTGDTDGDRGIK